MSASKSQLDAIGDLPYGLKQRLMPIWNSSLEPKDALAKSREVLEEMYYHLRQICGIQLNVIADGIDKLVSAGVIAHDVAPYFHLWWRTACLGNHFQAQEGSVSWSKYLEMCRSSILICMNWYVSKYPPIHSSFTN